MKVEIDFRRGEVSFADYDTEFREKLWAFLEEKNSDELYSRLRKAHNELIKTVEEVIDSKYEPFEIVIKVNGARKKYGPGPCLY